MDGPDNFSIWFPLPYRLSFLYILGIWAWGLNLHLLYKIRINGNAVVSYLRHSPETAPYPAVYRLAAMFSGIYAFSIMLYWHFTSYDVESTKKWEILPILLNVALIALTFSPFNTMHKHGRYRLLRNLRRIMFGGIDKEERFADVLLADALTSYAKVLGDTWIAGCMFLTNRTSMTKVNRSCGSVMPPLIIALPFMIRLRQCVIEYFRTPNRYPHEKRGHLNNALKYASAFPLIALILRRSWWWCYLCSWLTAK